MAPRKSAQLDLSLSRDSQARIDKFNASLASAEKSYQKLVDLAKKLSDVQKALNAKAAAGDLEGFTAGAQARANRRAARNAVDGTLRGATLNDERERARLSDTLLKSSREQARNQEAMALSVTKTIAATRTLTTIEQAKAQLAIAERRLGLELLNNDSSRIVQARKLVSTTQERIVELQREQALLRENANIKPVKPVLSDRERLQRTRELTNERLFGDGGANLLRIQAGLAANYMALNAVRTSIVDSMAFAKEFDASLRNLQAVVVITDQGLQKLKGTFTEISNETKFSAVEISDAAVMLGQAGLSVAQIQDSIRAIAMLATASGASLADAGALATTILGVFNLEAGQTGQVANTLTEAVNTSKLDIEKLALGLQYAGNTASEAGLGFEETTAALGAMSNMGIRSGSTLGTGLRQILISLQKPSKAFSETLDRLGLTMADVDVRTHGLYGVMTNLVSAGFTAGDAIRSFEIRGAAAYSALSKNLEQMLAMETSFYDTTAAVQANDTQMRSLENQAKRFGNTLHSLVASGMEPLLYFTRDVFEGLGDLLGIVDQNGVAVKILVTGVASLAAVGIGAWAFGAVKGLAAMLLASTALRGGLAGVVVAGQAATAQFGLMGGAASVLTPFMPVLIGLTAVLSIGTMAWNSYSNEVALGTTALANNRAQLETTTGEAESYAAQISTVSDKIQELQDREKTLNGDKRLLAATVRAVKSEFADMGLDVASVEETVQGLITALSTLRGELLKKYILKLEVQREDAETVAAGLRGKKALATRQASQTLSDAADQQLLLQYGDSRAYKDIFGEASAALTPEASTDELKAVQRKLVNLVSELQQRPDFGSYVIQAAINKANSSLKLIEEAVAASQEMDQLGVMIEQTELKAATARSAEDPEYIAAQQRLDKARVDFDAGVRAIQQNYRGDAIGGYNALRGLMNMTEATLRDTERELERMVESGQITKGAADALALAGNDVRLKMDEQAMASDENAKPMREFNVEAKVEELAQAREELKVKLGEVTRFSDFNRVAAELFQVEADYNAALAEQLAVMEAESSSGEIQAAQARAKLEALTRAKETQETVVKGRIALAREAVASTFTAGVTTFTDFKADYTEGRQLLTVLRQEADLRATILRYGKDSAQVENLRISQARAAFAEEVKNLPQRKALMDQFDQNNPTRNVEQERIAVGKQLEAQTRATGAAAAAEAQKMILSLQQEQKLRQLISVFGEDSVVVARARAAAERETYEASLATMDISESTKATLMELWDQTNGVTGATWGWADAMAGVAAQIQGIMNALASLGGGVMSAVSKNVEIAALKAGKTAAEARRAVIESEIETEYKAREMGAKNWLERGIYWADKEVKLRGLKLDEELETLRANAPTPKSKKGGGGGGKGDTAFDRYMTNLEGNVGAAITSKDGDQLAKLMEAARVEMHRKATQISFLQGQTLSAEKQKELNQLVKDHQTLQEFILDTEKKISETTGMRGVIQFDLNGKMKQWADQNLNMLTVLEGGVSSVLSGWKGAFSTLFTDLADDTKSGKEALRDFALAAVRALQSVVAEMLAVYAMKKLLGWLGGTVGGDGFFSEMLTGLVGARDGGPVAKMAGGGRVKGNLARDSVPALLMPDEYVLRASAVQAIGVDRLDEINAAGNRRLASGGGISGVAKSNGGGAGQPLNIWMAPPDQRPIPGPNDIIAVISDDMARGGTTKRLVQSIQRGV